MKIKAFLLTIVVIFNLFCCISCSKDREYDETEVITAAKILIKKSEKLNDLYYGFGILYEQNESQANGYYYPADSTSLRKFEVETIEDIKTITKECFTVSLSNSIINTKLSSVYDEDSILGYARYYQKYDALDNQKEECIMVYKDAQIYLTDTVEYDYESIYVSDVEGEEVFVTITATVTTSDGKKQNQNLKISLLEEENGWRINSPTYVKYVDRDYYDDLQD